MSLGYRTPATVYLIKDGHKLLLIDRKKLFQTCGAGQVFECRKYKPTGVA